MEVTSIISADLQAKVTFIWICGEFFTDVIEFSNCCYVVGAGGGWVDGLSPDTKDSTPELEDVEDLTTTVVSPIGRSKTKK